MAGWPDRERSACSVAASACGSSRCAHRPQPRIGRAPKRQRRLSSRTATPTRLAVGRVRLPRTTCWSSRCTASACSSALTSPIAAQRGEASSSANGSAASPPAPRLGGQPLAEQITGDLLRGQERAHLEQRHRPGGWLRPVPATPARWWRPVSAGSRSRGRTLGHLSAGKGRSRPRRSPAPCGSRGRRRRPAPRPTAARPNSSATAGRGLVALPPERASRSTASWGVNTSSSARRCAAPSWRAGGHQHLPVGPPAGAGPPGGSAAP